MFQYCQTNFKKLKKMGQNNMREILFQTRKKKKKVVASSSR